jgi:hypothetical protein
MRGELFMDIQALLTQRSLQLCGLRLSARLYLWPWLQTLDRNDALLPLVVLHTFRFVGLSFLVPGVVSPSLPSAFAVPAAFGDLGAAILALAASVALVRRWSPAIVLVWLFNLWGTADLLFAFYQGVFGVRLDPRALGAAFFIPTVGATSTYRMR